VLLEPGGRLGVAVGGAHEVEEAVGERRARVTAEKAVHYRELLRKRRQDGEPVRRERVHDRAGLVHAVARGLVLGEAGHRRCCAVAGGQARLPVNLVRRGRRAVVGVERGCCCCGRQTRAPQETHPADRAATINKSQRVPPVHRQWWSQGRTGNNGAAGVKL
jgi:hypothetical protein